MDKQADLAQRRHIRLRHHDYSLPGAYFVTICAYRHSCIFGHIVDNHIALSPLGRIVDEEMSRTAELRPSLTLDCFTIMPNHVHAVLVISHFGTRQQSSPSQTERYQRPTSDSIPTIIRLFKSATTSRASKISHLEANSLWQRGYYEHVIRDERSLERIREYIANNPAQWALDRENPDFIPPATTSTDTEPWMV